MRAVRSLDELGIKFFAHGEFNAQIYVDNIMVSGQPLPKAPLQLINFRTSSDVLPRFELFETTFELSREYANPFDPEMINIEGCFIAPSGEVTIVPGFFYQNYFRTLDKNVEVLTPAGRGEWHIRFAPREIGAYSYFITIDDGDRIQTERRTFNTEVSANSGFLRVSRADRRYFEFADGDFYYPIGHNIPAVYNEKAASILGVQLSKYRGRGTFAYDGYLEGMHDAGENYARMWLSSWSFGLEWTHNYDVRYHGLGVYNLENAWRLDYVLRKARQYGIYTQLALTTFGHYRSSEMREGDWSFSPYNKANGGMLGQPAEFWSNPQAQKYYQRMLRYVCARWGYDTNIMSWEVCNEIDLIDNYQQLKPQLVQWHRDCAQFLRRYDQGRHLITTNFSNWTMEPVIIGLDEISYTSTNWYIPAIVDDLHKIIQQKSAYNKPAIMTECGYHFDGAPPDVTERYITVCLWSSYMMPFAGAGMQWWWDFIDDRNLYHDFTPLVKFAAGEERRGRKLENVTPPNVPIDQIDKNTRPVVATKDLPIDPALRVECLRNDTAAYLWIYDANLTQAVFKPPYPLHEGKAVSLPGLVSGEYSAEFWDTVTGEIVGATQFTSDRLAARFTLPAFRSNIAVKVKPVTAVISNH
jgi:hypothetical protein